MTVTSRVPGRRRDRALDADERARGVLARRRRRDGDGATLVRLDHVRRPDDRRHRELRPGHAHRDAGPGVRARRRRDVHGRRPAPACAAPTARRRDAPTWTFTTAHDAAAAAGRRRRCSRPPAPPRSPTAPRVTVDVRPRARPGDGDGARPSRSTPDGGAPSRRPSATTTPRTGSRSRRSRRSSAGVARTRRRSRRWSAARPARRSPPTITWSFTTADCPCALMTGADPGVDRAAGAATAAAAPARSPTSSARRSTVTETAQLVALRFWKEPGETGTHVGRVWSSTGTLLASVTYQNESASGWQRQALATPLTLSPGQTYVDLGRPERVLRQDHERPRARRSRPARCSTVADGAQRRVQRRRPGSSRRTPGSRATTSSTASSAAPARAAARAGA